MVCESGIQEDTSFFSHLIQSHTPATADISSLLNDLRSQDSEPTTKSFEIPSCSNLHYLTQ